MSGVFCAPTLCLPVRHSLILQLGKQEHCKKGKSEKLVYLILVLIGYQQFRKCSNVICNFERHISFSCDACSTKVSMCLVALNGCRYIKTCRHYDWIWKIDWVIYMVGNHRESSGLQFVAVSFDGWREIAWTMCLSALTGYIQNTNL